MSRTAVAAAAAVVYYGLARIGLELAPGGAVLCPIWPLAGAALAAVAAFGPAAAAGIFLGSLLACWHSLPNASALPFPAALSACAGISLGAALQAWAGARLLGGPLAPPDPLSKPRDVVRFAAGAPLIALIGASMGAGALQAAGLLPGELFAPAWLAWWAGDAAGVILAAPLLSAWRPRPTDELGAPLNPRRAWNALVALAALAGAVALGFAPVGAGLRHPLTFLPLAALLWMTAREGSRGATAGAAALAALVHWQTIRGYGPFALEPTVNAALLWGTAYAVAAALTAFLLRAVLAQRRSEIERLEEAREALELRQAELNEDLFAANARLRDAALARRADHRRLERYRRMVTKAARRRLAERGKKVHVFL